MDLESYEAVSDPAKSSAYDLQLVIQQIQMDVSWNTGNRMPFRRIRLLERPTGLEFNDIHRYIFDKPRATSSEQ